MDLRNDHHRDVAVCGAGLTGLAAALAAVRPGAEVTLLDLRGDLAWEVSRALARVARPEGAVWDWLCDPLEAVLPNRDGLSFPAWIEIAASRLLTRLGVRRCYFGRPVAAWREGSRLAAIGLATKSGTRRISAAQWIDATETGELAALLGQGAAARAPRDHLASVLISADRWQATGGLQPGGHADDRLLQVPHPGADGSAEILDSLGRVAQEMPEDWLVSLIGHRSLPRHAAGTGPREPVVRDNVVLAGIFAATGLSGTPEERIELGRQAARALKDVPRASEPKGRWPEAAIAPAATLSAEVMVAGAGTGGAVAAIAAARGGADTLCSDILPFPGGTGVGSGIHSYCFGVSGGLQEEIDDMVQQATPLVGSARRMRGYHPDLRRLILSRQFADHGVRFLGDALLFDVERRGGRIAAALLATDAGVLRVEAGQWVDSTGDGDLCALAGVPSRFGRDSDGIASPYTQSGVWVTRTARGPYLGEINYDSGWVDPTDAGDLTRARIEGLEQLDELAAADEKGRLIATAPMVGLRQSRQIRTRTVLTLDDLVRRRRQADAVGHVGAHFDNHMLDYYLESPDAIFWVWCSRQWRTPLTCDLPLGTMQPEGLDNVLLACRAFGVSRDVHHVLRMMRDMHRMGEAAGGMAALLAANDNDPLSHLRDRLSASGALIDDAATPEKQTRFGADSMAYIRDVTMGSEDEALADLRAGRRTGNLWLIYKDAQSHAGPLRDALASDEAPVSWVAACIAGLCGWPEAEARLLSALESREEDEPESTAKFCTDPAFRPFPPNWVVALAVLGACGGARAGQAIVALLRDDSLAFDLQVAAVRALAGTVRRGFRPDTAQLREIARTMLDQSPPGSFVRPQQLVLASGDVGDAPFPRQVHDMRWKLTLAFAQLFEALGEPDPALTEKLAGDPRAFVRNAPAGAAGRA